MPQCAMMLNSLYNIHDRNVLKIAWILDCSKPFNSKETVPGTYTKLGFRLFYIILSLTWQCSLHKMYM